MGLLNDSSSKYLRQGRKSHGTNTKANDKDRNREKCNLQADVKFLSWANQIRSDDSRTKCHNKASKSNNHGAVPLVCLGPVLGVLRVVRGKSYQLVTLFVSWTSDGRRLDWARDSARVRCDAVLIEVGIAAKGAIGQVDIEVGVVGLLLGPCRS